MHKDDKDEIIQAIKDSVQKAIEVNVNGKIDKLTLRTNEYIDSSKIWRDKVDDHMSEDRRWKEDVVPSIQVVEHIREFSKSIVWLLKFIIMFGAGISAIVFLFKLISK